MPNKFVNALRKHDSAIKEYSDVFGTANLLKSSSPGFNWLFGKNHGLPKGFGLLLWGEEKAGKSLICNDLIANLHQTDEEAIVLKWNPEFREEAQLPPEDMKRWGIDQDRLVVYQTNEPENLFDVIEHDVVEQIELGMKIGMIIVDPITGIRGRRGMTQESVSGPPIGDRAATYGEGFMRILKILRNNKIGFVLTTHATPEMDRIEQMRGNTVKTTAPNKIRHLCEYFINVAKIKGKKGQQSLLETELKNDLVKGMDDDGMDTGHRIRCWLQANSFGAANRVSEFTFDYSKGIVNQNEEVFRLGTNWGIIKKEGNSYSINGKRVVGKPNALRELQDKSLQDYIVKELIAKEKTMGFLALSDEEAAKKFTGGKKRGDSGELGAVEASDDGDE